MLSKATKLALASRIIVLVLQLLANKALPDHKPDVFRKPTLPLPTSNTAEQSEVHLMDRVIQSAFGGLRHWDAEYFLHVAEYDYTYENTLAFYPFYPLIVRTCANALYTNLRPVVSLSSCMLLVGVLLNVLFFCKATNKLYDLTQSISKDHSRSWYAALLFCMNPATIFFTAAYSESLYCWLTFAFMHEIVTEQRFLRSTFMLALTIATRSNGLTNIGFVVYFAIRRMLVKHTNCVLASCKMLLSIIGALIPLTFFNFYAFQLYCVPEFKISLPPEVLEYGQQRHYIIAGSLNNSSASTTHTPSPWCNYSLPFPYSYIQSHYWNVGFMRYYQFKQLPNFLLAAPILGFIYVNGFMFLMAKIRDELRSARAVTASTVTKLLPLLNMFRTCKALPFVLHALILAVVCTFFVHVQIATRLLCSATPCLYWFGTHYMPTSMARLKKRSAAALILLWFGCYALVGTVMFANNLPWT